MARLTIPPYILESYAHGWSVFEPETVKTGKMEGHEYAKHQTFYPSLQQALNSLLDRTLRESDATSLAEIQQEISKLRDSLARQFEIRVRAEE